MKFLPLAALAFAGCATLSTADRTLLEQHRVSPPLVERMVHKESLDLPAVTELAKKKVPSDFTLRYLRSTVQPYRLNSQDVVQLKQAGVSAEVIDYMLSTPAMYSPRYVDPWYYHDAYFPYYSPRYIVVRGGRRR